MRAVQEAKKKVESKVKLPPEPIRLQRILRRTQLPAYTGLSRSVIAELIRKNLFPNGVKLNPSAGHSGVRGWTEDSIRAWQEERVRALEEEMRLKNKKPKKSWFDKV